LGTLGTLREPWEPWEPWEPLLRNLGTFIWEPGNLYLGTWEPLLGNLGTFTWEPGNLYLGTFTWEPLLGNLYLEPGNLGGMGFGAAPVCSETFTMAEDPTAFFRHWTSFRSDLIDVNSFGMSCTFLACLHGCIFEVCSFVKKFNYMKTQVIDDGK